MISNFHLELPSSVEILSKEEIHIWIVDLTVCEYIHQYPGQSVLSDEELAKAKNFKFDIDRLHFLASHIYLRFILSKYCNCSPGGIEYNIGKHGKPSLENQNGPSEIHFNMSHSGGAALYAISLDTEVGVDLELINYDLNISELIEHVFTPQEKDIFENIEVNKKTKIFYDIWTRKEAYLKATGQGLNFPPNKLEVTIHPNEQAKLISIDGDRQRATSWSLYSLSLLGYSAAIAIRRKNNKLLYLSRLD